MNDRYFAEGSEEPGSTDSTIVTEIEEESIEEILEYEESEEPEEVFDEENFIDHSGGKLIFNKILQYL